MASSSKPKWIYDVFLSFRGTDLRKNFLGHLYKALDQNGIYTFIDSEELRKGEQISPTLMKAIKESCIAVIVFSEDYASSRWCLEELEKIMECKEKKDLTVLPVFYKVDPRDVRGGRNSYGRALAEHELKFGKDSEKVRRWKEALFDAGSLSGWHLNDGDESELIQSIVKKISTHLDRTPLHVTKHPVGIDSRVVKLKSMSNLDSDKDVLVVGLWGKGGIGKTTLAKAFYNAIFRKFEGSCFLANVRETSQGSRGLVTLQELLLNDILLPQQRIEVSNMDGGINLIQHRLCRKKVLLILDDVDDLRQLRALAGEGNWFGNGSRIIVTTRDKQLLNCLEVDQDHVYEVKALDDGEAYELLTNHAFPTHQIVKIRTDLVNSVLSHAKGLPLALEVLGSFLCGRREHAWESTLKKLSRVPNKMVNDVLKISYDGLEENEKEIFLHIACFFKGWAREYIKKVLDSCDLEAVIGLEILIEKSLIRFENGILEMHDLIQFLGMDIVNQECRDDPGKRSRLWLHDDILNVLSSDMEDCAVKAIMLKPHELKDIYIGPDAFTKMRRLRLLLVRKVHNSFQGPICLPCDLRWFEWLGCAPWIPEFSSGPKKLVGLDMSKCSIMVGPNQFKNFQNLKYINFRNCESLVRIPDLSCTPTLEELDLSNCKNLVEAHESIAYHDKLQVLNLWGCSELSVFPNVLKSKSLRELNIYDCTKFERFPDLPHKLEGLKKLCLRGTAIKELPASIENLVSLEKMELGNCKKLVSLPSSIYKLQNIDHLELRGCTNLIRFPKYEDSADPLMRTGPSNLRRLSLDGCNLSEIEFLENLSCFPFLRELHLDGNNIITLPTSINKRDRLSLLNVTNCHQLQEIPELPPFLSYFWADNCKSLQKTGDLTSFHDFVRRGLTMADITSLDQDSNYSTFLPGGKMPQWIHSVEQASVSFKASEHLYDKFIGFAFCFVLGHHKKEAMFEILPHVDGKRLQYPAHALFPLDSDHIWLEFVTPSKLWGAVNFGQTDGSYVQFSLAARGATVKKWGFRIICEQLEDDLKVVLQDNQLIDPALLYEVGHESTNLETESSLMHEDTSMGFQDCQMSTEKHSQIVSMRNHELILPQGTQTTVQPTEIQSPNDSGEQTNVRTSSIGDSAADEPEPGPIDNPSATGSGTAPALTSTAMPTTSTVSMPSLGAAETVDLPTAQPSTVAEESEVSDVEMADLEAIDEILGVVKPRRKRPLPSGSDSSTPGAVDGVRAKWEELYKLTKEGYSSIASNSSIEDRIKSLFTELSFGDDCFTKTSEFQNDCEEFATLFADGIEVFRKNCDKIESSTAVEESFNKLEGRLTAEKKILKERRSSYQAAINKKDELTEEKERLEVLLAEVKCQIELNHIDIRREGKSMKRQFREVDAIMQECDQQEAEVERHLSIKRKCTEDNKTLDGRLSTFRRNVKRRLDDM